MAVLLIKHATVPVLQYPLNGHPIHIGRDDRADIHLLGESVSRQHGVLTPDGETYRYTNLGRNGTRLSGKKISDHVLMPGDALEIADWELLFQADGSVLRSETVLSTAPRRSRGPRHVFVGESPAMREVQSQIEAIAQSDAPVCLLGETGSGKEVAAHTIHTGSARARGPFVAVNCGAIPPSMIESELFGFVRGAFTGSIRDHRGYFEQASGGTLFLDEIGELSLDLQTRFLRVLETGIFQKLGAQSVSKADFRIICATHRDLQQAVAAGEFRADLFFRLYVLPLCLPPLRDHVSDIPELVDHFTAVFGRAEVCWSAAAMDKMMGHSWPGNVRELKNTVQRALVLTRSSSIDANDVFLLPEAAPPLAPREKLEDRERMTILRSLERFRGNNTHAAAALGISRTTLIAKIKKFNITPPEYS